MGLDISRHRDAGVLARPFRDDGARLASGQIGCEQVGAELTGAGLQRHRAKVAKAIQFDLTVLWSVSKSAPDRRFGVIGAKGVAHKNIFSIHICVRM